jgi:hypothetical protein
MKKLFLLAFLIFLSANLYSQVPGVPVIISPSDSATLCPPYIFDWNDVPTATSYKIQFSMNYIFTALILDEDINISQYTLPNGILSSNVFYYWRVRAANSSGPGSYSPIRRVKTGALANPPALVSPPNGAMNVPINGIIFVYNPVGGALSYIFQLSKFPTFDSLIVNDTTPLGNISLVPNTTYYWRMCSISQPCGAGNWSSVWTFTTASTILPPPSLIYPPNNSINISLTPTLDWTNVTGATAYRVLIGTIDTTVFNSELSIPPGKFNYNTVYYWRVSTVNIGGQGSYSPVWTFITLNSSGIHQISTEIPTEYKLYNNYPNPFNPSTNIKYQITNCKFTTIKVFDVLGREVETLVNENQSPGIYEVTFDRNNLPSGFYYYTIRSGDFADTKKMVMIK